MPSIAIKTRVPTRADDEGQARQTFDSIRKDLQAIVDAAADGPAIKEGSNAAMGSATLVGGTVTVSNTRVAANSRIFLTVQALGGIAAPVGVAVTARVAGTSFTITSASALDTSTVAWLIVEPL